MSKLTIVVLVWVATAVMGCAGEGAARRMADTSAALTNQFSLETRAFFRDQDTLNRTTAESISRRQRDAAVLTIQNRIQRATWVIQKKKDAVEMFDALAVNTAEILISSNIDLESLHPTTVTPLSTVDPKPFDDLVATLKKLATSPTLKERGSSLLNEGIALYGGYNASLKKGSTSAKAATMSTPAAK